MTEPQILQLGPALTEFLQPYLFCCGWSQTFDLFRTYCQGLLSDLPRKSAEPIALQAGVAPRTMQEFLRDHQWDYASARKANATSPTCSRAWTPTGDHRHPR